MDHYVCTGFDENYWQKWGVSWIASLKELAKYNGNIIIVDFGLSQSTKNKLLEFNCEQSSLFLLPTESNDFRGGTLQAIAKFAKNGIYAAWDADVYFQMNIDEVFDLAKDQIVLTDNPGFYAAPSHLFSILKEAQDLVQFVQGDIFSHEFLTTLPFVSKVSDTWNFIEVAKLHSKNDLLTFRGEVVKTIHPSGLVKTFLKNRNIVFWEKYNDVFNKYSDVNYHLTSRKLII